MIEWVLLILSIVAATAFLGVVAFYVAWITRILRHFGSGSDSALGLIAFGVEAIDIHLSPLPAGVPVLNENLRATLAGLKSVDGYLVATEAAQE